MFVLDTPNFPLQNPTSVFTGDQPGHVPGACGWQPTFVGLLAQGPMAPGNSSIAGLRAALEQKSQKKIVAICVIV